MVKGVLIVVGGFVAFVLAVHLIGALALPFALGAGGYGLGRFHGSKKQKELQKSRYGSLTR